MNIADLLAADRVGCRLDVGSKKRAIEVLSGLLATGADDLRETEVFSALLSREKLGSTGLGHGVALPHGRSGAAAQPVAAFATLASGVDYDAADGQRVDLLFALLVPEASTNDHLLLLAQLAEMFSDPAVCAKLRAAASGDELLALIRDWKPAAQAS